ncbi:putative intracellular septation protein A [Polynucleobacter sp. SHI8]|uniref:septation protein A n=1 Tax=unclassified Polynucleobacter TaxID=2640945 RepID=UPI0024933F9C|nr:MULTISPECIES: septation protein A [unclassified Polynucleobacter]BDW11105.1 putative intracellular septation protein A [Polynucleobacter sp. SHI2]BDW13551.1 putative intracellular septation protein A [Polynucleobacter sp. SHI8]
MKFLFEFLPILAFFIAFKTFDIYVATGVAIAITLLQMIWLKMKNQPITKMQIFNFLIILVFGGLTIFLHDKTFIMIKPTILYWSFALALGISFYLFKKNLIQMVLGKEIKLKEDADVNIWSKVNLSWIVYFAVLGVLNLYVAYNFSEETWVNFKLSTIGVLLVFIILQGLWLSKYIQTDESETP